MLPHTLAGCAEAMRSGAATSESLTRAFLDRIEALDPTLCAFVQVDGQRALEQARRCDAERAASGGGSQLAAVHGVPIAVKDLFDEPGEICTGGSAAWRSRRGVVRAPALASLRAQGAVVLGRTQMAEFAVGATGINRGMGTPRNPCDDAVHRIPGGSSSGSAVAVAARLCAAALGSDTGGSVRIPAALNGVVGFKPTAGTISTEGTLALSTTLDSIGTLAWTVEDAAILSEASGGPGLSFVPQLRGCRLAMLAPQSLAADCDNDVLDAFEHALATLRAAGVHVDIVDLDKLWQAGARANGLICFHEAWQRHHGWIESAPAGVQELTLQRILAGADTSAAAFEDLLAARRRDTLAFAIAMKGHDALLVPSTGQTAQTVADADPGSARLAAFTRPVNYLGGCAISLPTAPAPNGLPTGVQLIAPYGRDGPLLGLAAAVESLFRGAVGDERTMSM